METFGHLWEFVKLIGFVLLSTGSTVSCFPMVFGQFFFGEIEVSNKPEEPTEQQKYQRNEVNEFYKQIQRNSISRRWPLRYHNIVKIAFVFKLTTHKP